MLEYSFFGGQNLDNIFSNRYYKESEKILGNTYGMCVLQDFEAMTPNLLARTIETVEGGGLIILLLKTMTSLRQLYTMTMVRPSRCEEKTAVKNILGCSCTIQNLFTWRCSCKVQ